MCNYLPAVLVCLYHLCPPWLPVPHVAALTLLLTEACSTHKQIDTGFDPATWQSGKEPQLVVGYQAEVTSLLSFQGSFSNKKNPHMIILYHGCRGISAMQLSTALKWDSCKIVNHSQYISVFMLHLKKGLKTQGWKGTYCSHHQLESEMPVLLRLPLASLKTSFKALLIWHMYASLQLQPQQQNAEHFHSTTTVEHTTVTGDTYQSYEDEWRIFWILSG